MLTTDPKYLAILKQRFEEKYEPEPMSGCWLWSAALSYAGYGVFAVRTVDHKSIRVLAHRLAYEWFRGPIPSGLDLDHLCRNRCCVNPYHLEAVTHQENCRRGQCGKYQLIRTHCPKGHPYSEENMFRNTKGGRQCRICCRAQGLACWRRKRDAQRAGIQ
jgi:hypothetical protein